MPQRSKPGSASTRGVRSDQLLYAGLAGFRSALRKFLAFSEVAVGTAGVTTQQYQAMLSLAASEVGTLTMKQLATEMLLRPNGAVQLVDRLEGVGLVRRTQSTTDRRSVSLSLTSKGQDVLKALATAHRKELLRHSDLLLESLQRLDEMHP